MKIFKYELNLNKTLYELPAGAEVLSAEVQGNKIVCWARVDPEEPNVYHHILIYGTGWYIPEEHENATFVSTVLVGPDLIFHVFDGGEL